MTANIAAKIHPVFLISRIIDFKALRLDLLKRVPEIQLIDGSDLLTGEKLNATETSRALKDIEILIVDPTFIPDLVRVLPESSVKWIQASWVGLQNVATIGRERSIFETIQLTRLGGQMGSHMAEYVIAQIIAWDRQFYSCYKDQQWSNWNREAYHGIWRNLDQMTITIIGFGDIGIDLGRACRFFGASILGIGRRKAERISNFNEVHAQVCSEYGCVDQMVEFCSRSHVVISVLPATSHTDGILDNPELWAACANLKPLFINIGRGNVISEETIIKALDNGYLSSAVLDVFPIEPLPKTSRLWTHPKCIITPHVANKTRPDYVAACFAQNYRRLINRKQLLFTYDPELGY